MTQVRMGSRVLVLSGQVRPLELLQRQEGCRLQYARDREGPKWLWKACKQDLAS